jgi:hypothetical protein
MKSFYSRGMSQIAKANVVENDGGEASACVVKGELRHPPHTLHMKVYFQTT